MSSKVHEAAKKRSTERMRTHTAYHEAGHAVFAVALGHRVREVRISATVDSERPELKAVCMLDWNPTDTDEILVALAGMRGQEMLVKRLGLARQSNAWGDLAEIETILAAMPGATPKATAQRLHYFTKQSREIAARDDVRKAVQAVAAALLESEAVSGDDVENLCATAGLERE